MERHESREATVVPILVRECTWKQAAFAKLQVLSDKAKPLRSWSNRDKAWKNVAEGLEAVIEELGRR